MRVISRTEWGATAPLGPAMRLPVAELWLHHSVSQLTDDPHADMKAIERIGVQRFGRFSYSWAYHAKARVLLEGAGDTVGAHTAGRNSTSLGLVLIGNYDTRPLTDDNIADLRWVIAWLIGGNRLRPGTYPTGGHRDLKQTACPGGQAYARLDDMRGASAQPVTEDDVAHILKHPNGTMAVVGPGAAMTVLHTMTEVEALQADGSVTGDIVAPGDTLIWDTRVRIAQRANQFSLDVDGEDVQRIIDALPDAVKQALREGVG